MEGEIEVNGEHTSKAAHVSEDHRVWESVKESPPPENTVVETKIDDEDGARNEGRLKRRGRLWWFTDDSMYVYYAPTHWRPTS